MTRIVKKFEESESAQCRWSEYAAELIGGWDVVWEDAEVDYQGHANILACDGKKFMLIEWSYGSCSGCDGWEDLSDADVREDFGKCAMEFSSVEILLNYIESLYGTMFPRAKELMTALMCYTNIIDYENKSEHTVN